VTGAVRALTTFLLATVALVVLVDVLAPVDSEQGAISIAVIFVVAGGIAGTQILVAVTRSHRGAWRASTSLLAKAPSPPPRVVPEPLRTWEALLISATTGGPRARERLAYYVDPLTDDSFTALLPSRPPPTPDAVLDAVEQVLAPIEETDEY
jgi:hypothetical protein